MSDKRGANQAGGGGGKVAVLESCSVLPHTYQTWREDTRLLFESQSYFQYLSGEVQSVFDEPVPCFAWQLEIYKWVPDRSPRAQKNLHSAFRDTSTPIAEDDAAEAQTQAHGDLAAKTNEDADSEDEGNADAREGYTKVISVESPDSEGFVMADSMRDAPSLDFYYRRQKAHIKALEARERRKKEAEEKTSRILALMLSTISASVQNSLKTEIAARRLDLIWAKIAARCGPRSGTEGLAELDKAWATTTIKAGESMGDFLQRIDREARKFDVYGPGWVKTEEHRIVLVRQALVSDTKRWPEWKREIRDADRLHEGWEDLKTRLEKLAGEMHADEAVMKDSGKKTVAEKALAAKERAEASAVTPARADGDKAAKDGKPEPRTTQNLTAKTNSRAE
ncbi:hypothetical protein B484DRAFT_392462 [Ochromonadaceae sp. CCMP2298]|nr:hypothetical protein B484DRAFT_392462 [Ochromonadaceae sp. CCMP2298]